MFKLIKATAVVSIATVVTIFAGLVKAKFTAVALGPTGVGVFSQASNFLQLLVTISTLGIGLGVTKYISKYNSEGNTAGIEGTVASAFWLQAIMSSAVVVVVLLFSKAVSTMLFASQGYGLYLFLGALGVPFFVLAVASETVLLGFGEYRSFTKAKSLSALLVLVPLVVLIHFMHIEGAFLYLAIGGLVTFLVYYFFLCRTAPKFAPLNIFNSAGIRNFRNGVRSFGKDLLPYGATTFVTSILGMVNIVFLRSLLIWKFGPDANGFYQVVFTMSAYYLTLFTNGLWSYFYPKVSATEDRRVFSLEVNYAVRFAIFGIIPFIAGLFLFRYVLIHLVFSKDFIYSADLFATQLFGDLFYILFYIMGTALLAGLKFKAYLVFSISYSALLIGSFVALMNVAGIKTVTISYLITNAVMFIAVISYYLRGLGLILYIRNVKLLLSASALLTVIFFFGRDNLVMGVLKVALLAVWVFFLSRRTEKTRFKKFAYVRIRGLLGYEK